MKNDTDMMKLSKFITSYNLSLSFFFIHRAAVYFLLFGFDSRPFLELHGDTPPLHSCSTDPQAVRNEVEMLRRDFNVRFKKIIFGSVVGAYYTSFVPCIFAEVGAFKLYH